MNACESIKNFLNAYLDEELDPAAFRKIEVHLNRCSACRSHLEELKRLSRSLDRTGESVRRAGEAMVLWPEISAVLKKEEGRAINKTFSLSFFRRWRPIWIGAAVSAAALIIFFSGILGPNRLPANYCRIESISAPNNNLMIYRDQDDGLTVIWLME